MCTYTQPNLRWYATFAVTWTRLFVVVCSTVPTKLRYWAYSTVNGVYNFKSKRIASALSLSGRIRQSHISHKKAVWMTPRCSALGHWADNRLSAIKPYCLCPFLVLFNVLHRITLWQSCFWLQADRLGKPLVRTISMLDAAEVEALILFRTCNLGRKCMPKSFRVRNFVCSYTLASLELVKVKKIQPLLSLILDRTMRENHLASLLQCFTNRAKKKSFYVPVSWIFLRDPVHPFCNFAWKYPKHNREIL